MYERTLHQMRERIRTRRYVLTLHAEEEMNDDGLSIFDVERAILTGKVIERQTDHTTGDWKYLIAGQSVFGDGVEVVAKIGATDKLVVITVYRERQK